MTTAKERVNWARDYPRELEAERDELKAELEKARERSAALLEALEYCEAASNQPHVFKHAAAALEKAKGAVLATEVKS